MTVTLVRRRPTAKNTGTPYAQADEAVKELLRFRTRVGVMATLAAELEARYGPAESWDARTWDEYEHRAEADAWKRAAAVFGGGG
ncbi:hypothetical protein LO772_24485 [Yinghuangia sp. ASG 101]|uniref:hypothetical protein n=1 Tax=Yinghuangia sp. ASG 101 TaxID=2896848 RepID=UPI001E439B59|nr:hypothetical protein [Yinghuangia sp. ASG 101]UGQ10027.1 hypothetical protein LO772_24485 [Yinghuangia sp. ASG 101]